VSSRLEIEETGSVWHVVLSGVEVRWPGIASERWTQYGRDFDIVIDSSSGHLLRIESVRVPSPADIAIDRFAPPGGWACPGRNPFFAGYPDTLFLPMVEVLSQLPDGPHEAEVICARYVLESKGDSTPSRPLWVIHLLGITPVLFFGPAVDDTPCAANTQTEVIYDVRTKRLMTATPYRRF